MICPICRKASASLKYDHADGIFKCRHCLGFVSHFGCRPFEYGHENSMDPKGSTAHVRDIKDRRYHPKENRTFYYSKEMGKTYFFPKG
jgi:hypothetical protein